MSGNLSPAALEQLVHRASEEGARKALAAVGLHDEDAAGDIREVRGLLEAWRDAKKTAGRTVIQAVIKATLILLAAGAAWHLWGKP